MVFSRKNMVKTEKGGKHFDLTLTSSKVEPLSGEHKDLKLDRLFERIGRVFKITLSAHLGCVDSGMENHD